ncbi:TPA: sensor histidine kinase [Streptococcus agalactiae]|nr:sensor histidine kinase [Streptococcus agalactiae]
MRGYRMEEGFKKRLQDDISKHFSRQSLILSLLLIALFVLFSLAPQQIGLYKDVNSVSYSYKQLIQKHDTLLDDLGKNSLKPFVSGHLGSADLSKQYYHLRNHLQSQTELLVFSPNQELLFASNSHLGNFFSKSIYISEVLDKAKINQRLLKIIVDSEGGHYLALIKPIIVNKKVSGYAFLLMNGKDFLLPTKAINSDLIIADQLNNSFTFTNRDFISSSLDKVDSQFLTRYFSFHDHRAFVVRKVALQDNILLYMYRPLIPVTLVVLFSLVSSVIIFVILRRKSRVLADRIAVKNSSAINQMVLDMDAISRQEKSSIELDSQDEFQYLSVQINQMVSRLKDLHEKTLDLETQKLLFEKRMLEAQFNPHFLYNTLETVLITSHYDSQLTERIVIQLTKLLRYSLSGSTEAAVLKDDLAIIESYLLINQVRFEELTYTISVSPELEHMRVPKLFLLPLIENAIKYGLKERHDVAINIDIWQDSDGIWFTVSNNGSGISLARQKAIRTMLRSTHSHHGLINSYRRLQYQFSTVLLEFTKTDDAFRVSYIVKE